MSPRLAVLVAVALALLVFRVAVPPSAPTDEIAQPVARSTQARSHVSPAPAPAHSTTHSAAADVPGNAFSVRRPAPAPVVPALPSAPTPAPSPPPVALAAPIQPLVEPPAPPPLQVIGTYDDGGPPAVFLATPSGTLIARTGSVLLADYRVTGVTPQSVALVQLSNQRTHQLAIPGRSSP